MRTTVQDTVINAAPETIWNILTNAACYPHWHPEFTAVIGTIAAGQNVTLLRDTTPKKAVVTVTAFVPPKLLVMTSSGGLPAALLKVERAFALVRIEDGAVLLTQRLEFSGVMSAMVLKSVPDQQPILAGIGDALKKTAEAQ